MQPMVSQLHHPLPRHDAAFKALLLFACRTDLPYASVLGPDPVPDRAHVFFVSSQDPFDGALPMLPAFSPASAIPFHLLQSPQYALTRSAGHSVVSAAFWQAGLGQTRVTMQRGGRTAWVELQARMLAPLSYVHALENLHPCRAEHISPLSSSPDGTAPAAISLNLHLSADAVACLRCCAFSTLQYLKYELQDADLLSAPDPATLVTTKLANASWSAEVPLACLPIVCATRAYDAHRVSPGSH